MRVIIGFVCLCMVFLWAGAMADVPNQMNFQGKLSDGNGNPIENQTKTVTFTIYDHPTEFHALWTEAISVNTGQGGVFSVILGQTYPLGNWFFDGIDRYLGIRVEPDVELSPRIKITTNPFAQRISTIEGAGGGTIAGGVEIRPPGSQISELGIGMWGEGGAVFVKDENGNPNIVLQPDGHGTGGDLVVFGGNGHFEIEGNFQGTGMPVCYMGNQSNEVWFDLSQTSGDNAVHLQESSISATEILNEPGIAEFLQMLSVDLPVDQCASLVSGSISIPGAGYVVVEGKCNIRTNWSENYGSNGAEIMIDTILDSSIDNHFRTHLYFSLSTSEVPGIIDGFEITPAYATRTYYFPSSGTHTFLLKGKSFVSSPDNHAFANQLTMMYFPTAYGQVQTTVAGAMLSQFEQATPITPSDNTKLNGAAPTEQMYMVDLRELELRVAKADAALQKAKANLMRAELDKQRLASEERLRKQDTNSNTTSQKISE